MGMGASTPAPTPRARPSPGGACPAIARTFGPPSRPPPPHWVLSLMLPVTNKPPCNPTTPSPVCRPRPTHPTPHAPHPTRPGVHRLGLVRLPDPHPRLQRHRTGQGQGRRQRGLRRAQPRWVGVVGLGRGGGPAAAEGKPFFHGSHTLGHGGRDVGIGGRRRQRAVDGGGGGGARPGTEAFVVPSQLTAHASSVWWWWGGVCSGSGSWGRQRSAGLILPSFPAMHLQSP